jgi:hypothetical protein
MQETQAKEQETKKKNHLPSDKIKVKIGINEYEIKYPNNGQLIDIERLKIQLTGGTHKDMIYGAGSSQHAYVLTEAIATFTILVPDLKTDLQVGSLLDLNPYQSNSILKAYEKSYHPWIMEWNAVLDEEFSEEKNEKKQ